MSEELGMPSLDCTDLGLLNFYVKNLSTRWKYGPDDCIHLRVFIPLLHLNTYVQFVAKEINFHGQRSP